MANKYKYVCTVFTLFGTAPACVRGSGQRISCMSGTRYRSPDSRPSAGVSRARGRAGCWRIRVGRRCPGLSGLPGSEARPRSCGLLANQEGGVSRSAENPGRVSVCPAVGRAVGCRYGCRPARKRRCGRMPGPPSAGCLVCRDMRGSVTRTAPSACRKEVLVVGTGALPCLLPAKNEGSPERLPSPSKINP